MLSGIPTFVRDQSNTWLISSVTKVNKKNCYFLIAVDQWRRLLKSFQCLTLNPFCNLTCAAISHSRGNPTVPFLIHTCPIKVAPVVFIITWRLNHTSVYSVFVMRMIKMSCWLAELHVVLCFVPVFWLPQYGANVLSKLTSQINFFHFFFFFFERAWKGLCSKTKKMSAQCVVQILNILISVLSLFFFFGMILSGSH